MTITPQTVQAEIDTATKALGQTTSSHAYMVRTYGADWTKWPKTSTWYVALDALRTARTNIGHLGVNTLKATFAVSSSK